jgi:hypothetical protein
MIADPALTYIPLVNSAMIFFGIGAPWLICTIYKGLVFDSEYFLEGKSMAYICLLELICFSISLLILILKRLKFDGEIGGKYFIERNISGSILIIIWIT